MHRIRLCPKSQAIATLAVCVFSHPHFACAGDVLTGQYNNARTGAVLDETALNTSNVNSATFGRKWTLFADGQVVAQPLYVSALAVDTSANSGIPLVKG